MRKAVKGEVLGRPPYGYKVGARRRLELVPEEAVVVRYIFRLYLQEGLGIRLIARRLNEEGLNTSRRQLEHGEHPRHPAQPGLPVTIPASGCAYRAATPPSSPPRTSDRSRSASPPAAPATRRDRPPPSSFPAPLLRLLPQQYDRCQPLSELAGRGAKEGGRGQLSILPVRVPHNQSMWTTIPAATRACGGRARRPRDAEPASPAFPQAGDEAGVMAEWQREARRLRRRAAQLDRRLEGYLNWRPVGASPASACATRPGGGLRPPGPGGGPGGDGAPRPPARHGRRPAGAGMGRGASSASGIPSPSPSARAPEAGRGSNRRQRRRHSHYLRP